MESAWMLTNRRMNFKDVINVHSGGLLVYSEGWNYVICRELGGAVDYFKHNNIAYFLL